MEVDYSAEDRDFLAAVGTFLLEGLRSVSEAYPGSCGVTIGNVGNRDSGSPVED
jgi:hypothetical protein